MASALDCFPPRLRLAVASLAIYRNSEIAMTVTDPCTMKLQTTPEKVHP
jgi:hypothetical protein